MPLRLDAILHGILAWGLITLITLYLVITGVGTVIGGALSVVQRYQQLRQDATDVAQEATNAVAMSAWWTFFVLLAGAIAAAVGSALAAPRDLPAVPEVRRE
jgi:heme/copper-type cytochrome/quinol oxidase subunit 2